MRISSHDTLEVESASLDHFEEMGEGSEFGGE
jgi:hypothetical protein